MTLAEKLLKEFAELPEEQKKEVIDFIEYLKTKTRGEVETAMDEIIAENREALEELGH